MMMPGNDPMTKKSRELYIGNLPDNVPEQQLMSFLNAALLQVPNPQPISPGPYCDWVWVHEARRENTS